MKRDTFPVLFGVVVSTVLAGTLVLAGLKAGITPGVSPLVILFAWGAFTRRIAAGGGTRFLNLAQVAGSAGMAVTAGVIFTAPLLQILYTNLGVSELTARGVEIARNADRSAVVDRALLATLAENGLAVPPVDVVTLILLSFAGALVGFGFVGLGTRKFLTDPTLPAPEARACETMIEAAVARPQERPRLGRSLFAGTLASFLAPLLVRTGLAKEHVVLHENDRGFQLDLPFTPIYIGIGGLLTLSTALLVFGGSSLNLIGRFLLSGIPAGSELVEKFPDKTINWVGGGAMTVAVGYSLVRFMGMRGAHAGAADELVEVDPSKKLWQRVSIVAGMVAIVVWLFVKDGATPFTFAMSAAILGCASLMVVLGAILSLQIGSSASPVSGTIFVTTLVLCLVAIAVGRREVSDVALLTPLLVGACVAVCTANDSSQDYKTMQLCGVRVQDGFLAQALGLVAGCIVVPLSLYYAHEAYVLGSTDLNAPQGKMFATLVTGLLLEDKLPWYPICIGLAVGALAVAMDVVGGRRGLQLPAMALAVGIYLPAYLGVGILIGSLFRFAAERGRGQSGESILTAAGLITGAALLELLLGVAIVQGMEETALEIFTVPGFLMTTLAVLGILGLGGLLWFNSRGGRRASV